jgi:2'-5' RNA ligase
VSNKFLCLLATFDEETTTYLKRIESMLCNEGFSGKQTTDIPHHITLAYYNTTSEDDVKQLLQDVCAKSKSFNLSYNHIGLFGLEVMFLAPDVNSELLELRKNFVTDYIKDKNEWTAHTTILIDEAENIQKALPIVAHNFQQLNVRVESVSLYEFFPTRFIAKYSLQ